MDRIEASLATVQSNPDPARFTYTSGVAKPDYQPLKPGSFRYLDLECGQEDDPLVLRLAPCLLENPPAFEAISYHWDKHSPPTLVHCDGIPVSVSGTITSLLHQLRHKTESRRLWIDELCINQQDVDEVTDQVKQMGHIYTTAKGVVVWLGDADNNTSVAYDMIESLYAVLEAAQSPSQPLWEVRLETLYRHGLPGPRDSRWPMLSALLSRRWFSRTWILQEIALNDNVVVQCGQYSCKWVKLKSIVLAITICGADRAVRLNNTSAYKVALVDINKRSNVRSSLFGLLATTLFSAVSDPRDKVYAIVGLSDDQHDFIEMIDYRKSVADVYLDIAEHYLTRGILAVLNFAGDHAWYNERSLPSWVPDWSKSTKPPTFVWPSIEYTAAISHLSISGDRRRLTVKASKVDHVSAGGRRLPLSTSGTQLNSIPMIYMLAQWQYLAHRVAEYPTGEDITEVFARTLTADSSPDLDAKALVATFEAHQALWRTNSNFYANRLTDDSVYAEISTFHERMRWSCRKRSFFVTPKGYMGLGPRLLQPGDEIWRIVGAQTPFALRRKGKQYELVGEVFVYGLMNYQSPDNGEARQDIELV